MNILAFGAHPDDIEIGAGGTLSKYAEKGDNVTAVVVTLPRDKKTRRKESEIAAKILGINIKLLDVSFEDLFLTRENGIRLDGVLDYYRPDIIFTHWDGDSHQDHNVLTSGVIASARMNRCSLYMYEQTLPGGIVPSSFNAQVYIDITATMDKKIESILAHASQHRKNGEGWLHGIRGRAMLRGCQINVKYAEAFQVVKRLCL